MLSAADPWNCSQSSDSAVNRNKYELKFEDNFSNSTVSNNEVISENKCTQLQKESMYVALDDTEQYLAKLQSKLSKLVGSDAKATSSNLLKGLTASRQAHQHSLLSHCENFAQGIGTEINDLPRASGVLISEDQQYLNTLLQRIVPEKLALSPEELVKLLAADSLANNSDEGGENTTPSNKTSGEIPINVLMQAPVESCSGMHVIDKEDAVDDSDISH